MYLSTLLINHFRNFKSFRINDFNDTFNVIYGENSSGKTSILESLYFLSSGKSFRSPQVERLINYDATDFQIYAAFKDSDSIKSIACKRKRNGEKTSKINGEKQYSQKKATILFPVQIITPESFSIISKGAQQRSKILDWGVFYSVKKKDIWNQIKNLIKQRNVILKKKHNQNYLNAIDLELSKKALTLDDQRKLYFKKLVPKVKEVLSKYNQKIEIFIDYYRGWSHEKSFLQVMQEQYYSDLKCGFTNHGPHRADLIFQVNGRPAHEVLSRGQQKLLICAVKIAQGVILKTDDLKDCLYLLDDLSSELDSKNLKKIFESIRDMQFQTIITAISKSYLRSTLKGYDCKKHWI